MGTAKGTTGFVTGDDELRTMKSATSQIYFLLWFFWRELGPDLSNPHVHTWLAREHGLNCSDDLSDGILTKLRKAALIACAPKQP